MLNCLAFGNNSFQSLYERIPGSLADEKFSFVVNKYGAQPSIVNPNTKALIQGVGMHDEDILATFNALLSDHKSPRVDGCYADRLANEPSFEYLRRIHRLLSESLSKRIPVIASVESYAAHEYEDLANLHWKGSYSHAILITSVPRDLKPFQKGFTFTFVDSLRGTIEQGYVYIEDIREFQAGRRRGSDFHWANGSPFLLVILPSLGLATEQEPQNHRTIITLSYLIGRFSQNR